MTSRRAPSGARLGSPSIDAVDGITAPPANCCHACSSIGAARESRDAVLRELAIGIVAHRLTADADDGDVVGKQAVDVQVVERRQQLAVREIAPAAEDDDRHDDFFTAWPPN